jgi:hypothetical protein
VYRRKSLSWNIFFNFWYPWSPYCGKKYLDLYIVHDPKCFDQRWSGHWVKSLLLLILVTLERYVTNLRSTRSNINSPRVDRKVYFFYFAKYKINTKLKFISRNFVPLISQIVLAKFRRQSFHGNFVLLSDFIRSWPGSSSQTSPNFAYSHIHCIL